MDKKSQMRTAEYKVKQCYFVMEHTIKMIANKNSLDGDDLKTIAYLSNALDQIRNDKTKPKAIQ